VFFPFHTGGGYQKMQGRGKEGNDDICRPDEVVPLFTILHADLHGFCPGGPAELGLGQLQIVFGHRQQPIPGSNGLIEKLDQTGG